MTDPGDLVCQWCGDPCGKADEHGQPWNGDTNDPCHEACEIERDALEDDDA